MTTLFVLASIFSAPAFATESCKDRYDMAIHHFEDQLKSMTIASQSEFSFISTRQTAQTPEGLSAIISDLSRVRALMQESRFFLNRQGLNGVTAGTPLIEAAQRLRTNDHVRIAQRVIAITNNRSICTPQLKSWEDVIRLLRN